MRYVSLCSGIEAASVAWQPLGWEAVAFAEIEKFPKAVLKHHYPTVPDLGDVSKITQQQIEQLGHVDVVIFGFPCTDLSVAGQRKGLKHADGTNTRSGLFFDCLKVARWTKARWIVAENVPGLYSSSQGRDFATVVGTMVGATIHVPKDGWRNSGFVLGSEGLCEFATLDAQFFGLAQRRERVFFVLDTGDWANRPPLLLEPTSMSGNPPPCRKERQDVAPTISARVKGGVGLGTDFDCDGGCIPINMQAAAKNGVKSPNMLGIGIDGDPAFTVNASDQHAVAHITYCGDVSTVDAKNNFDCGDSQHLDRLVAHTLRGEGFDASEDGTGRGIPLVPVQDPPIVVTVLDTVTGETAGSSSWPAQWWMEGNGSCDCNRELLFGRDTSDGTCICCKRYVIIEASGLKVEELNAGYPDDVLAKVAIPKVCGALNDGAHNGGGLNGQDAYSGRIIATSGVGTSGAGLEGSGLRHERGPSDSDASRRFL